MYSGVTPFRRRASPFVLAVATSIAAAGFEVFDVTRFGARGDGRTLCTTNLQEALDAAGAAGGGVVRLPAGTYLSGAIRMHSGVTLEITPQATLLGSRDRADYLRPPLDAHGRAKAGEPVRCSLVHGIGLHDVAIRGGGTIDGSGDAFREENSGRPKNIQFETCTNVIVEQLRLRSSGSWMQNYRLCERVVLRDLEIFNHATFNNDGIDIDSSCDVLIERCAVDSDDDGICLKSTTGTPCRRVRIADCTVSSHCNAFKMGTESGGGFLDIIITNCSASSPRNSKVIYGDQRGLAGVALEIVDGGRLENVTISDVRISGVKAPLFLRLGDRGRKYASDKRPDVGTFRNVRIANITAERCSPMGCAIAGLPGHPIRDVTFENIRLGFDGGGDPATRTRAIEEKAGAYPECRMFGDLPAYGLFCRHVTGLRFSNVALTVASPDPRWAMVFDDAADVVVDGLDVGTVAGGEAWARCVQSRDVTFRRCSPSRPLDTLVRVEGDRTRGILIEQSDLRHVRVPFVTSDDVPAGQVERRP